MDKLREACGIVALAAGEHSDGLAEKLYMGLISIQHRGQESAGIAMSMDHVIHCYKGRGLVSEVFNEQILSLLAGDMCLGHVKYGGQREYLNFNAEPTVIKYKQGQLAVAFNGALTNGAALREALENNGAMFATQSDSEVVAALVARYDTSRNACSSTGGITKGGSANGSTADSANGSTADSASGSTDDSASSSNTSDTTTGIGRAVQAAVRELQGGFAFGLMTGSAVIGARDVYGIRPLCLGQVDGRYAIASESRAFDMMDGVFIRDIQPGEIVVIENGVLTSLYADKPASAKRAGCVFEYVYFANPDSTIDGINVYQCRERAGYILAKEAPADADMVIGAPDSGTPSALGYAMGSGIPYTVGLIKNKYIGRTFIQPTQSQREMSVRIKLNPIRPIVEGKRIVLVDDSIVRGTTMRYLIAAIRNAGASAVHLRITSPPVSSGCYFGVDTPDTNDLIASHLTAEEVRATLGADSLAHISIDGMLASLGGCADGYCVGCFNGQYPGCVDGR